MPCRTLSSSLTRTSRISRKTHAFTPGSYASPRMKLRGSLNFAVRGSELLDGSETATTELAGNDISASKISIHHADQAHSLTLLRKLLVNASMIAPERAYTDDRNVYKILKIHRHAPSGKG